MAASSVTGIGQGIGTKEDPIANPDHVLFSTSANDGDTISSTVTVVFVVFDDDYTLHLPSANTMLGREILFRSRATNGHTVTITGINNGDYNFSSSYINMRIISDGTTWTVTSWYNDD